jgi:alkylation response protein AidB-like acyl-CoA dehydrogenase
VTDTQTEASPSYSPEEAAYREGIRAWLEEHSERLTDEINFNTLYWMPSPEDGIAHFERSRAVHKRLHEAGYIGITWPTEAGGQGGEAWQQRAFKEETTGWDVHTGFFGSIIAMAAPAIMRFGTPEQVAEHMPSMLTGDIAWCQLFSEPGAGSDLAALGCRAELDGDEFVINGQKVWNSAAMWADRGILLVRTDPDAVKHAGVSFLLADLRQPGVEVRPLVQANGAGHFAEVFFDNFRVPAANLVGEVNDGWRVARMVLASEAQMIGGATSSFTDKLFELARIVGRTDEPVIRQQLADHYAREKLLSLMGATIAASVRAGKPPAIDGSVMKLYIAENRRRSGHLAMELLGAAGTADTHLASNWAMESLHMRFSISIGGGTDEVHHNNLGERALGLPREPRADKDVPWKDVPKG